MIKVVIDCCDCNNNRKKEILHSLEVEDLGDIPRVCPKCKSADIFYREIK